MGRWHACLRVRARGGGGGFSGISGHDRKISGDNKKINTVSEKTMCVEWGSSKLFRLTTPRLKEGRISDLQTPAYVYN